MTEVPRVQSLADLGKLFPEFSFARPDENGSEPGILTTLQNIYRNKRLTGPNSVPIRHSTASAIIRTLETDETERKKAGIHAIMIGPPDAEKRMTGSLVFIYPVYVVFPYFGIFRYLPAHRLSLANAYSSLDLAISQDVLHQVDNLVTAAAEQVPEKPHELYNRLLQEIKMTDSLIKEQKDLVNTNTHWDRQFRLQNGVETIRTTPIMEKLNWIKTQRIHEYLITADALTKENPGLAPLYTVSSKTAPDSIHKTLEMCKLADLSLLARLVNPAVLTHMARGASTAFTNINLQALSMGKARYLHGSSLASDRSHHETAKILGL